MDTSNLTLLENSKACALSKCLINLSSIKKNIITLKNRLPLHTSLMIMVKANAYGTDSIQMCNYLSGMDIDIFGLSYVEEAVNLRKAGISSNLFVLHVNDFEAQTVAENDLEAGVSDLATLESIEESACLLGKKIKIHIHLDSGMSRLGCKQNEALYLAQKISASRYLKLEGVMTHFSAADDPAYDLFTLSQAAQLTKTIMAIESYGIHIPYKHAANSAACARFNFPEFNRVRLGLAPFGLYSSKQVKEAMALSPAISLVTQIVSIMKCQKGDPVSYGCSYHVNSDEARIAVLAIGYHDGLHRYYGRKNSVLVHGKKAPIVGRICMDYMMIDLKNIPEAKVNDPVLIFGQDDKGRYHSPEIFAENGGSIPHELIACLGPRVQRIFY